MFGYKLYLCSLFVKHTRCIRSPVGTRLAGQIDTIHSPCPVMTEAAEGIERTCVAMDTGYTESKGRISCKNRGDLRHKRNTALKAGA